MFTTCIVRSSLDRAYDNGKSSEFMQVKKMYVCYYIVSS